MVKKYTTQRLDDGSRFVIGTSYISPIQSLTQLSNELESEGFEGEVYFDLLLANNNSDNRFLVIQFKNGAFERQSAQTASNNTQTTLKEKALNFFNLHSELLSNGVLTASEREFFLSVG